MVRFFVSPRTVSAAPKSHRRFEELVLRRRPQVFFVAVVAVVVLLDVDLHANPVLPDRGGTCHGDEHGGTTPKT